MVEAQLPEDSRADYREKKEATLKKAAEDFDRFDLNDDGSLSKQECRTAIVQLVGVLGMVDPDGATDKFMHKYDLNNDGRVTKEEYLAVMTKIFDEAVLGATDVMSGTKTHE